MIEYHITFISSLKRLFSMTFIFVCLGEARYFCNFSIFQCMFLYYEWKSIVFTLSFVQSFYLRKLCLLVIAPEALDANLRIANDLRMLVILNLARYYMLELNTSWLWKSLNFIIQYDHLKIIIDSILHWDSKIINGAYQSDCIFAPGA